MRYSYYDLGHCAEGAVATVELHGSMANVILLDAENYAHYRAGRPFLYSGGLTHSSPVELTIGRAGHWFVVVDLGGFSGRVRARVRVRDPERAQARPPEQRGVATAPPRSVGVS